MHCFMVIKINHVTGVICKQNMTMKKIVTVDLHCVLLLQALAELCEIKFGKTHPVCSLVSSLKYY